MGADQRICFHAAASRAGRSHGGRNTMTALMTPRIALVAVGLFAAALVPAKAADNVVLKASDVHPAGYPTVAAVENMGKKLAAATNGRVTVQMFPAMQLGGEKEAIEQAQVGAIQLARVSV